MDQILFFEIVTENRIRVLNGGELKEYETQEYLNGDLKSVTNNFLMVITPFCIANSYVLKTIDHILTNTKILGVAIFFPSTLSSFCFETHTILFLTVNMVHKDEIKEEELSFTDNVTSPVHTQELIKKKIESENKVNCNVEIIINTSFSPTYSQNVSGNLNEVVHDVFSLINRIEDKKNLASNIYIRSRSEDLKILFQERLAMDLCVGESYGNNQIKYLKYLKIPSYIKEASVVFESVREDPVLIGACLAAKIKFIDGQEYTRREDFFSKDYKDLTIH
ncbi:hypothetical protein CWI37_0433p0030 [Hamiltosporidium tvaerminnensis]|uniref:Uncharacterized protein n=4 Tax=Hamiltosporidium TaxID=1176354 RepID=A0A4Q9LE02_9MICR|nr:hypothetical protein LUQ84_000770 [Hamiltosporidium tvaerminnensis]TBU02680.1 hypothetical protein CWI37_0433p0030 [Hamiltosporidium tvaerminnensis]TBU06104.1 hypothetical protein CWI36_0515p0030 [Hamiltosporidium magnivora]